MKAQSKRQYTYIICIHLLVSAIAFAPFLRHPAHILLSQWDDGLKNMYTLLTFVREPVAPSGLLKYDFFCYPFGDYVYYTDNTPLFSVPFKWFCHHVADISKYTIFIFQLTVILNITVCGVLVFYLFRRVLAENKISFILALILPWTNAQILRILRGHFNLSFSSLIIAAFCLLFLWHRYRSGGARRWLAAAGMVLLSVGAFLAHPYYLPIITIFTGASLFIYSCYVIRTRNGKISLAVAVLYPVAALGASLLILHATDPFMALRRVKANGYDWMEQKMRFSYLFSHYYFEKLWIPIGRFDPDQVEKPGFLGNTAIAGCVVLIVSAIVSANMRKKLLTAQRDFFRDPLKASLFIGSLVMLLISFGEVYYTATPYDKGLRLINIFNPFLYIHFFTNSAEQFRFLERFMWPFYFGFYLWLAHTILAVYRDAPRKWMTVAMCLVFAPGIADVYSFAKEINRQMIQENTLNDNYVRKFVPPGLHAADFQAILPIPYYFTGAEDSLYDYNIDGDPDWMSATYSMAVATRLPLMSSSISRTPRLFAELLMNFAANDSLDRRLRTRLSGKPILVAVNRGLINDPKSRGVPVNALDAGYYWKANGFALRNRLTPFDSVDHIIFYKWYPPAGDHLQ